MATASVTNNFTNGTPADADQVDANFADLVSFLNNSVVHRDGSKAMTAAFDAGSQKVVNVSSGTNANDAVNKSQLDAGGTWQAYTPTVTGWSLGNGALAARYVQHGKTVHFEISLIAGTTTTYTSALTFTLPVTRLSTIASVVVAGEYLNSGVIGPLHCRLDTTTVRPHALTAINVIDNNGIRGTSPVTWANTSTIRISGSYEAA